ncbi:MAG: hypothetical protein KBC06_02765 [Candidatus Pacebacteria bacterium]|nr:hypothetical protein [Candidatus Paceibacterota bacterium]
MNESQPLKPESVTSVDYKSFRLYQAIISEIDQRFIKEADELLINLMSHPDMMGAHEVEVLEELIFKYKGDKTSPMFIDVYKTAVNNFFQEAGKRNLLVKFKGKEGFGHINEN